MIESSGTMTSGFQTGWMNVIKLLRTLLSVLLLVFCRVTRIAQMDGFSLCAIKQLRNLTLTTPTFLAEIRFEYRTDFGYSKNSLLVASNTLEDGNYPLFC